MFDAHTIHLIREAVAALDPGGDLSHEELLRSLGIDVTDDELARALDSLDILIGSDGVESAGEELESTFGDDDETLEAIILPTLRPAFFLHDGALGDLPARWQWVKDAEAAGVVGRLLRATGRVDADGVAPYAGTGFLIDDRLLLTNRHVARLFVGAADGAGFSLRRDTSWGRDKEADPDEAAEAVRVTRIRGIHRHWDAALLELDATPAGAEPLSLRSATPTRPPSDWALIAGYPGASRRNPVAMQRKVFGTTFGIKRLMPGMLKGLGRHPTGAESLFHDTSTLGGCSGSPVVDPATGDVVGLHFAGQYRKRNYCVPAWKLAAEELFGRVQVRGADVGPAPDPNAAPDPDVAPDPAPDTSADPVVATEVDTQSTRTPAQPAAAPGIEALRRRARRRYGRFAGPVEDALADLDLDAESPDGDLESALSFLRGGGPDPNAPDVVLIPGLMGTELGRPRGFLRRVWISPLQILKGDYASRLRLNPDGVTDAEGLMPLEPISALYGLTAEVLALRGHRVHAFGYDWRKKLDRSARGLARFLEELSEDRPGKQFVIVAHSMGGLVTGTCAGSFPDLFDRLVPRVILLGSPLGGSFAVSEALDGSSTLLRGVAAVAPGSMTDDFRAMAASMPGLLSLLPDPQVFDHDDHAVGGSVADLYSRTAYQEFLEPSQRWLSDARGRTARARAALAGRDVALIMSLDRATSAGVELLPPTDGGAQVAGRKEWGDGTVAARSAYLPGARAFEAEAEHTLLPASPSVLKAIHDLISRDTCSLPPIRPDDERLHSAAPAHGLEAPEDDDAAALIARWSAGEPLTLEDIAWLADRSPLTDRSEWTPPRARALAPELIGTLGVPDATVGGVALPAPPPSELPPGVPFELVDITADTPGWVPARVARPRTRVELVELVQWCADEGRRLRPIEELLADPEFDDALEDPRPLTAYRLGTLGIEPQVVDEDADRTATYPAGMRVADVLDDLSRRGLSLPRIPLDGRPTLARALATGALTRGVGGLDAPGATLADLVHGVEAVIALPEDGTIRPGGDEGDAVYGLAEFTRYDAYGEEVAHLSTHLGDGLLVTVTFTVVDDYGVKLVNDHPDAAALFGEAGDDTFAARAARGTVEARLLPFTDRAWVTTWTPGELAPSAPIPHRWQHAESAGEARALAAALASAGSSTPRACALRAEIARYNEPAARVRQGSAAHLLATAFEHAPVAEALGVAVVCRRADLQATVSRVHALFTEATDRQARLLQYPVNGPLIVRATGLDTVRPGEEEGLPSPSRSAAEIDHGAPDHDTVVWVRVESAPGTPHAEAFFSELEGALVAEFGEHARPDPSASWAWTADGPLLDPDRLLNGPAPRGSWDFARAFWYLDSERVLRGPLDARIDRAHGRTDIPAGGSPDDDVAIRREELKAELQLALFEGMEFNESTGVDLDPIALLDTVLEGADLESPTALDDAQLEAVAEFWNGFSETADDARVATAEAALRRLVGLEAADAESATIDDSRDRAGALSLRAAKTLIRRGLPDAELLAMARQVGAPHPEDFFEHPDEVLGGDASVEDGREALRDILVREAQARRPFSRTRPDRTAWFNYLGAVGDPGADRPKHLERAQPRNPRELKQALEDAVRLQVRPGKGCVRVVGGSHSSSSVARPDHLQLDLSALRDITLPGPPEDPAAPLAVADVPFVRVPAGLTVAEANRLLDTLQLGLENMGSFDAQTLYGAMCTGTHGSGSALGPICDQLLGVELAYVGGDGAVRFARVEGADGPTVRDRWDAQMAGLPAGDRWELIQDDDLLDALRISVGAMGVVFALLVRVSPAYDLEEERPRELFSEAWAAHRDAIVAAHADHPAGSVEAVKADRFAFTVNPYPQAGGAEHTCVTTIRRWIPRADDPTRDRPQPRALVRGKRSGPSGFLRSVTTLQAITGGPRNALNTALKCTSAAKWSSRSHRILRLGVSRYLTAASIEIAIPFDRTPDAVAAMRTVFDDLRGTVTATSPFGMRPVRTSPAWLAPMSGRLEGGAHHDGIRTMVEVPLLLHSPGSRALFDAATDALLALDGRPHWGQLHPEDGTALARYPATSVAKWQAARERFDPTGLFGNHHSRAIEP